MLKNNCLYILLFAYIFSVHVTFGMQKQPVSLYEHCGLSDRFKDLPPELHYNIARKLIGKGGWWYRGATLQHDGEVVDVAFHPRGNMLATGSCDNTVCLWNTNTGQKLHTFPHNNWVLAVAFHPRGNTLATASGDTANMWEQHINFTLEQLLLRCVLKNYVKKCIEKREKPDVLCTNKDNLVPWMAQKFNLKQDELQEVWASLPEKLQTSIVATLLYRVFHG